MADERLLRETETIRNIEGRLVKAVLQYMTWAELSANVEAPIGTVAEVIADAGTHTDPESEETVPNLGKYRYTAEGWVVVQLGGGGTGVIDAADVGFVIGKSVKDKLNEVKALDDARTSSASDQDQIALAELINAGYRQIRLRGGKGVGTVDGEYLMKAVPWAGTISGQPIGSTPGFDDLIESPGNFALANGKPANGLVLRGDGMYRTRVKQVDNYAFMFNARSGDVADNIKGLELHDMMIEGLGGPMNQNGHILALYGSTDFLARRVYFYKMQSDGAYFSHSPKPNGLSYNVEPAFEYCVFDGFDKQNRQGISFEDCLGWSVDHCRFIRLSSPNDAESVAAIDVEPINKTNYRNGRGSLTNSRFYDLGNAALALYLNSPNDYTHDPQMFYAAGNFIDGAKRGFDFTGATSGEIDTLAANHMIDVICNQLRNVEQPVRAQGIHGLRYSMNRHEDVGTISIGDFGLGKGNRNHSYTDNFFLRAGRTAGPVFMVDDITRNVEIARNTSVDSGRMDGLAGWFTLFRYGVNHEVRLNDNIVINNNGRMKAFAQLSDNVTVNQLKSSKERNVLQGTALGSPDNFNPSPISGASGSVTDSTGRQIGSTPIFHDVTVPGAAVGMTWKVSANKGMKDIVGSAPLAHQAGMLVMDAQTFEINSVRLMISNGNPSYPLTLPNPITFTITQDA